MEETYKENKKGKEEPSTIMKWLKVTLITISIATQVSCVCCKKTTITFDAKLLDKSVSAPKQDGGIYVYFGKGFKGNVTIIYGDTTIGSFNESFNAVLGNTASIYFKKGDYQEFYVKISGRGKWRIPITGKFPTIALNRHRKNIRIKYSQNRYFLE
jgi:hypothetical protein